MVQCDRSSLFVKHLPKELGVEGRISFLKHFGAVEVKCLSGKSNAVIARFNSDDVASGVLKKLHQLELLGHVLRVEYLKETTSLSQVLQPTKVEESSTPDEYAALIGRLTAWPGLPDIRQPPPHHLRYSYPSPTPSTLVHICSALTVSSKFYTQVLHLMNRMNLPCPLVEEGKYPLGPSWKLVEEDSSQESELEDEEPQTRHEERSMLRKRKAKQLALRKPVLKPVIPVIPRPNHPIIPLDQVFEVDEGVEGKKRKIELKLSGSLEVGEREEVKPTQFEPLELEEKLPDPEQGTEEEPASGPVISLQALRDNRIPHKDQRVLPVFKGYQTGVPSCRLYIKNIAKGVTAEDLHFIYRRFYDPTSDVQGSMYDVRLMQEGRMKGQAFVTLQGVAEAKEALKETNGYVLKGKPLVVQFGRSSAKSNPL